MNCLQLLDYSSDTFTEKIIYDKKGAPSKDKTTVLYSSKNNGVYNFMQGLYTLYNLFEASVWQSYVNSLKNNSFDMLQFNIPTIYRNNNKNGVTLLKKNYAVTINGSNLKKYIDYVSPTLYETLKISANTINPFVARRILFMWIVLCNYFILTEFIRKEPLPINNQTNQLIHQLQHIHIFFAFFEYLHDLPIVSVLYLDLFYQFLISQLYHLYHSDDFYLYLHDHLLQYLSL